MKKQTLVIKPQEEYSYGHIIKALAGGLYPDKFHVIREYIQNSFDSIANWKTSQKDKSCEIKITIQKPSIFIFDNGTGMTRHTLNEYRKVGYSKKVVGESAGFRGIGKLSGISVAKKLIVTTSPYGINEKYILTFDAESMIREIDELKRKKANIPLNTLIEKHTSLSSSSEDKSTHYTMVELHEIKSDSKILFTKLKILDYISKNTPVPFDPKFIYGKNIEDNIKKFVADYDCINISVDGKYLFKPYLSTIKSPQHILVWHNKDKNKLLGFCWYCENSEKGQIRPLDKSGIIYRYKNFAVGDHELPRRTLWNTSPHLSYYFIGEIYICNSEMIPTSQRDDFEQNVARDQFYNNGQVIANELNRLARDSSGIRRAEEYVKRGVEVISEIKSDVDNKESSLKDLGAQKIAKLVNVIDNIEKRKKNIPKTDINTKRLAKRVVKQAKKLLKKVEEVGKTEKDEYNIIKKLKLDKQAEQLYTTIIRTLKDYFVDKPEALENIIKIIHKNLINTFRK